MKLYRSALVAGVLALGVAACGDDVEIVQPSPTPPDPPPAVTASMAPASASVLIGNSVVFAVNASGGVVGDAASWTCASSNSGIATVSVVGAGCQATGVAAGSVTVTATVTKSGETVNVGAQLTVTDEETGEPAFIVMTLAAGQDADDLSGRVNVTLSVERGDQTLERLSLLVDGEAVAYQSFGSPAMAAPEDDEAAEQAVHQFTLGFDSNGYDDHGHPDYMNGEHTISAELQIAGGMMADGMMGHEIVSSNVLNVEFDNEDGFDVTADLGQTSALDDDGRRWYGGPANGHIVISALPVNYSGEETGAVTISLTDCEAEEGDGEGHGGEGVSVEFDCEGQVPDRTIAVSESGRDATILNADDLPEANIDMEGPAIAPYFYPNPNNRELGWVNLAVDFLGEQDDSKNEDGWLTYNDDDADTGVGGYQTVIRYAEADGLSVEDAIAAAHLSLTNPPGESEMDFYCAVASAVDALGNESSLPDEDDGICIAAVRYESLLTALADAVDDAAVTAAEENLANAGLRFGVDITPPGIEIDEDDRINTGDPSMAFDVYDDENEDHNSGLHSLPLLASAQLRDTDDANCLDISDADGTEGDVGDSDDDCDDPTALEAGTALDFDTPDNAYYTVQGVARDKAGNHSAMASHTFVFDDAIATATAPAVPGALEAGEAFQVASFLNDDLSIRDYYVTANFPDVGSITPIRLGIVTPTVVDAFDADPLTHRNHTVTANVDTYAGLQESPAGGDDDVLELATVTVAVRDQADSDGTNDGTNSAALTVEDADDGFDDEFAIAFTASEGTVGATDQEVLCAAEDIDDCEDDAERETELEVVATATDTGAFSDPFERVDFWVRDVNGASWLLGSDTSGASDRVSSSDRRRTWTYSLDATAVDLYMLTREAAFPPTSDSDSHTVLAFAVNDDGVALVASVALDIDDGEDDQ